MTLDLHFFIHTCIYTRGHSVPVLPHVGSLVLPSLTCFFFFFVLLIPECASKIILLLSNVWCLKECFTWLLFHPQRLGFDIMNFTRHQCLWKNELCFFISQCDCILLNRWKKENVMSLEIRHTWNLSYTTNYFVWN